MTRSAARQGPRKVWSGYKNLRVPVEIFDAVKQFLERSKNSYLEGEDLPIENVDLEKRLAKIEKKLDALLQDRSKIKLPAKERIRLFLVNNQLIDYSNKELSEILGIAEGTARQVCHDLSLHDKNIHVLDGRPKRYYYQE